MISGMEGKEGMLVFYEKSEDGFMQGCVCLCMCFIVEIKNKVTLTVWKTWGQPDS